MGNELRKDDILDRWVIIASGRGKRPTDFIKDTGGDKGSENCFFCPGREDQTPPEICRDGTSGEWGIRVFPNKFPAVTLDLGPTGAGFMPARGVHEIIVESPVHGESLSDLDEPKMTRVLKMVRDRVEAIYQQEGSGYVLVFKNHKREAGASLSHTHSQVMSMPFIPKLVREEAEAFEAYRRENGSCLLCDQMAAEQASDRVITEDGLVLATAPYASRIPFESRITFVRHVRQLSELTEDEFRSLARALILILSRLKRKLNDPPYNMCIHASPREGDMHLHLEILPKLSLWAGLEVGGEVYINVMPPEEAAGFLASD
ncbi:galactose-1-phosphate uridylyltransferase [Candidatus Altiarchaeota archaeon]